MGDAAGIGPEIVLRALGSNEIRTAYRCVIIGDAVHLRSTAVSLGINYKLKEWSDDAGTKDVEIFDLAMLYNTRKLVDCGLLREPVHVQFVMGIQNALPARRNVLEFMVSELQDVLPTATWTAAGIGRHQLELSRWALELGGHVRTGLEDNIRVTKERLAASNAELVRITADLCAEFGARPATAAESRQLLGIQAN